MDRLQVFLCVSVIMTAVDLIYAFKSRKTATINGKWLCLCCLFAGITTFSYALSLASGGHYFLYKVFNGIYFSAIDLMVVFLLELVISYVKQPSTIVYEEIRKIVYGYAILDICFQMINPFREISLAYPQWDTLGVYGAYGPKMIYHLHLIFTYILILSVLVFLVRRIINVPNHYKAPYVLVIVGILGVVGINAIFLYAKEYLILDYSIWAYSLVIIFIYWVCFTYTKTKVPNQLKGLIFDNIDQGIVLFDYEENLVLKNKNAENILPDGVFDNEPTLNVFIEKCGISGNILEGKDEFSFQWFGEREDNHVSIRCECKKLRDHRGAIHGIIFVFTDMAKATDILTGFTSWNHFQDIAEGEYAIEGRKITVAVFDINGLTEINRLYGRTIGDQAILLLAGLLRKEFPKGTVFVRGREAALICVVYDSDEEKVNKWIEKVRIAFNEYREFGCFLNFQNAVGSSYGNGKDVLQAIEIAFKAMQGKKLLDAQSKHSPILTSLMRALQESDGGTEAHVKRTQELGAKLGKRLGLTEAQQSDLALLCMLHDIGKIGIPVEVLNKPGTPTEAEWRMIQTHVEKGYQIANSAPELRGIAQMIRFHHERWDGKGYPEGISKETIPILSRIIAVVDSYDAMINDRPYRSRISKGEALNELLRCAGNQFDPSVVSAFVKMIREENVEELAATDVQNAVLTPSIADEEKSDATFNKSVFLHGVSFSRYILNDQDMIIDVDKKFEEMTGYTKEEVVRSRMNQADLIFPEDRMEYFFLVSEQLREYQMAFFEHRLRTKDGKPLYVYCVGRPFYDSVAKEGRNEILITDSTNTKSIQFLLDAEHDRAHRRLRQWEMKYRQDSLTGLLNHEAFKNDVEEKLLSGEYHAMLLMIDVDKFKEYNDTFGHRAGDEFLITFARILQKQLRSVDLACRMGGDEFAAVLFFKKHVSEEVMKRRAEQICNSINKELEKAAKRKITISMGVVIENPNCNSFDDMYETADQSLYYSKEHGRAKVSFAE